jgi:opacity protein-like surface antigen
MKNWSQLMRRLSVVAALAVVLALAAGAPALQAQPEAGSISTGAGVQVWNGHSCPANVPVNISGLNTGLGGYEAKIAWPAGRFDNTPANVSVTLTTYLAVNGRVNSLGSVPPNPPAVAQPLKAVVGDTVKFADFSYGTDNPAGNTASGQLATVSLLPTATCGPAALSFPVASPPETQLVDINGAVIDLTGQTGSSVSVYGRYDVSPGGPLINSGDVGAVVGMLNQPVGAACGPNYRFDVAIGGGPLINSGDVGAVVAKLNQNAVTACVN